MLRAIHDRVVIDPYYEGGDTKIGSIIIPDSMTDSQPSQGVVVSATEKYQYLENRYVIFHRYRDKAHYKGLIVLDERDLVCFLDDGEVGLFEHRKEYLILPNWTSKYRQPSELIYLPPIALEHNQPVMFGEVIQYSLSQCLGEIGTGYQVAIEPGKGSELAVKGTLYYIVELNHILAIIHG